MQNQQVTFNDMPAMMGMLLEKVSRLETLLQAQCQVKENQARQESEDKDRWMSVKELQDYLPDHPALATLYAWTCRKMIPFYKTGKQLRFLKSEIDTWLKKNGCSTDIVLHKNGKEQMLTLKSV